MDDYKPTQPTQLDLEEFLNQPRVASMQDRYHDILGRELPDPTPLEPPIGYVPQESMVDHIRNMIRTELSRSAADAGEETFEEADDFAIDEDDPDPHTPYEAVFDPPTPRPAPADVNPPLVVEPETGLRPADPLKSAPTTPTVPQTPATPTILDAG